MTRRRVFALLPAAGIGSRMATDLPKQYLPLAGRPLAEHTLERLLALPQIERLMVALHPDDSHWASLQPANDPRISRCMGGASRAESVLLGFKALQQSGAEAHDWVLVHDMARPCVTQADLLELLAVESVDGALLAAPLVDTIKQAQSTSPARVQQSLDRSLVWRALTPQFFPLGRLLQALEAALQQGQEVTDEASAIEFIGGHPLLIEGRADNIKVTRPEDLPLAEFYLAQQQREAEA